MRLPHSAPQLIAALHRGHVPTDDDLDWTTFISMLDDIFRAMEDSEREVIPFTLAGPLYESQSARFYGPRDGSVLIRIVASLDEAGSTDTVLGIYKNGGVTAEQTITIPASANRAIVENLKIGLNTDEWIVATVDTPGTGAESVDLQCEFYTGPAEAV